MTAPWRQRLRRWSGAYGFIGLSVLAIFWMMDGVTAYRAPMAEMPVVTAADPAPRGRVFILLLDSLRYGTAIEADTMPHLARLRTSGTWAEVRPSYNAVTVSCLRAAFTGRDEVSVLAFVQNFLRGDAEIDSLFPRLAAKGYRTAAFSKGGFTQFGAVINPRFAPEIPPDGRVEDVEDAGVSRMLALFREGRHAVVIAHVNYTDYAAHKYGVGSVNYRRDFRRADRLVAQAAAAIPATDTLVVMGDHGHDEDGTHTLGQDVRTFLLYRGPAFKAGYDLGTVPIMSHYWLLGSIFGQPLPAGYQGGRYPEALTAGGAGLSAASGGPAVETRTVSVWLWIYLSLLVVFGAGLIWPARAPWMQQPEARWLVWLALPPAIAPLPWNAWLGAPVALAIVGWLLRGRGARAWTWTGAAVAAGLGWHGWGRLLAGGRDGLHAVTRGQLATGWLLAGALALLVATRGNRRWFTVAVGAVGFLALPTSYRHGFTGLMVPLLWLWLAAYAVSLVREGRLRSAAEVAWAAGTAGAIFAFTQLFAGVEAAHFLFRGFVAVVDLSPFSLEALMSLGLAAKLVIFYPAWPRRWLPALAAAFFIGALQHVQWRTWEPGAAESLGIIAGLLVGWLSLHRRDPEAARVLLLGLLFFLYAYCVRSFRESGARADCILAALVLAARWLRRFPQPENAAADCLVLGTVAFLATGYFTTAWSLEYLEWSRIYIWFPARLVESAGGAILLLPWLILKTSLPLFIAHLALGREFVAPAAWPGENLRRLAGFKILTLALVVTGLGVTGTVSVVYLEGVQQLTIMIILAVGLLFEDGTRPAASAAG